MIKTKTELATMRQAGKILARILKKLTRVVKPGVSTQVLNSIAERMIRQAGAQASFLGYQIHGLPPFPCALCTSINNEVVHGQAIPGRILKRGDIVGLDLGLALNGLYVDAAVTVGVGKISKDAKRLIQVTKRSLDLAIKKVKPGNTTGDIGAAVQKFVESRKLSIIRELVGHGVGHSVHELPQIPNFGRPGTGEELRIGMALAIEPMVAMGDWQVKFYPKAWRVTTRDGSLSAHFEHTVIVTKGGHEILTPLRVRP